MNISNIQIDGVTVPIFIRLGNRGRPFETGTSRRGSVRCKRGPGQHHCKPSFIDRVFHYGPARPPGRERLPKGPLIMFTRTAFLAIFALAAVLVAPPAATSLGQPHDSGDVASQPAPANGASRSLRRHRAERGLRGVLRCLPVEGDESAGQGGHLRHQDLYLGLCGWHAAGRVPRTCQRSRTRSPSRALMPSP